ncbi:Sulphate transporter [Sulfurimonas denitrificans DSM 1251]|uniref:Sulphate transporter n=1 Tax=Sulfurimonas denitrificans (strain ATCC 33889 / DSM 1251) TaxID=326298 RepID=Q30TG9_SULDN|nr:SulP family inorganic anion transporter [Sulfurimonas denitrificans]ABB43712.1 Sulphate transporter [Sulfurimonas denitrificans DSM 1251]MDD3442735.1 SulP family inorganic anion transporter [Sulfurimonas denitrificans]
MYFFKKDEWLGNVRADILSGLVVALALVPEAIAFSIIAGVDPKVGLYASFCIAVVISFVGGRTGMISAATGAMALVMVTLVKEHGLEYLLAATLLTGVFQIILAYLGIAKLMSFVARAVVVGFVNALAILIFMAQLPELTNVTWHVYALTAAGLGIIYLFPYVPKIGKLLPSPLVTIVVLTVFVIFAGIDVRTVGDMGDLPDTLPIFLWPNVPLTFETLLIIAPYAFALSIVGLLESFMTATIIDDMTDTKSDKRAEARGQGIANIASGCIGGMAGCAMIGQSVINISSGGRKRLSTFVAGFFLLILVVFLSDILKLIPMAALVAVMIMVSIGTFDWGSFKRLKTLPLSTNIVMLSTVVVTVGTHNLAFGVLTGVLLASLFFANKISHFMYCETSQDEDAKTYKIVGQVFFNSADRFVDFFDFKEKIGSVIIDLRRAHFWDISAVHALDKSVIKFRKEGVHVRVIGQSDASATIIDRFAIHDNPQEIEKIMGGH